MFKNQCKEKLDELTLMSIFYSFTETNHFIDSLERKLFWNFVQKEQQIYESSRQWLDFLFFSNWKLKL